MKPEIKYGLIYALISIVISLLMYVTGLNRNDYSWIPSVISLIVPIICTVRVIDETKSLGDGFITFGTAFKKCMIVIVIGSVISAIYSIIYLQVIDPEFMDFQMTKQAQKMAEMGLSDDEIETALNRNKEFQTPTWLFVWGLVGFLFVGSIIAMIVSAIKKNPNPEEII